MDKKELDFILQQGENLKIEFGEKIGSGIKRMEKICSDENAPIPTIDAQKNYFYVTFKQNPEYLKIASGATQKTTQKIIELIKENPSITRERISRILNLTSNGIKYHLINLKKQGKLKRIGGRKIGYWEVIEDKI